MPPKGKRAKFGPDELGSHVLIQRTSRPVRQFAILEDDLVLLAQNGAFSSLFFGLTTLALGFLGSCWLQGMTTSDPVQRAQLETAEYGAMVFAGIFGVLAVIFGAIGGWRFRKIWTNSKTIEIGS